MGERLREQRARVERFTNHWPPDLGRVLGRRVIIEGSDSDTTRAISCIATALGREIPKTVESILFDGFRYNIWPSGTTVIAGSDFISVSWRDFEGCNRGGDLGAVRVFIFEDGRVFVREKEAREFMYCSRILVPAIKIALERFGQCRGAGTFMMLLGQ